MKTVKARIMDFDGTLTNNAHRRHLRGLPYLDKRSGDTLDADMFDELVHANCEHACTLKHECCADYIVTGRDASLATETYNSLIKGLNEARSRFSVRRGRVPAPSIIPISYRPGGNGGPPSKSEKVNRIVMLANSSIVFAASGVEDFQLHQIPNELDVFEDEEETCSMVVQAFRDRLMNVHKLNMHYVSYSPSLVRSVTLETHVFER